MSWDIFLHKFDESAQVLTSAEDITSDCILLPLGTKTQIRTVIDAIFSEVDWKAPDFGCWQSPWGSIQFIVSGEEDLQEGILLNVRASAEVIPGIVQLAQALDCHAIDTSTGYFLERAAHPETGLQNWQAYRDQVVKMHQRPRAQQAISRLFASLSASGIRKFLLPLLLLTLLALATALCIDILL